MRYIKTMLCCGVVFVVLIVHVHTFKDNIQQNGLDIDPAHISKYGDGNFADNQPLDQYTTLHPSEQTKYVYNPHTNSVKKMKNKTMRVSSDKVNNGGRKGPMSGATNQGSSVPISILIPFPIIPVQGQGNAMNVPQNKKEKQKKKKAQKSVQDGNKKFVDRTIAIKQNNVINKHLIQLTNKQDNVTTDVPTSNVSLDRLRRDTSQVESNVLTENERDLRDKWLHPNDEDLIPGVESNYYNPQDIAFIVENEKHVREVKHMLQQYKPGIVEETYSDDAKLFHLRQSRGVDDTPIVEDAKQKLLNAEKAAQALTNIELEVGLDPEHLIENTHKYVIELTGDKETYDSYIRAHIVEVGAAIRRSIINNTNISHNESGIFQDINAAKRQLEDDRGKLQEINMELKELKDIELMAAGLEVAKYVAKERALENLAAARSNIEQVAKPETITQHPSSASRGHEVFKPISLQAKNHTQPFVAAKISPSFTKSPANPYKIYADTNPTSHDSMHADVPITNPEAGYQSPTAWSSDENVYSYRQHYNINPLYTSNYANANNHHIEGDQRHTLSKNYLSPEVVTPIHYVNLAKAKVGKPDHEITKIEQSHKTNDNKEAPSESGDSHDWGGMLTFPGTTYSPPPSWLQGRNDPYARQNEQTYSQASNTNNNPTKSTPYVRPVTYRPTTEGSPAQDFLKPYSLSASQQRLTHPYSLSEAIASTLKNSNYQSVVSMPTREAYAQSTNHKLSDDKTTYLNKINAITTKMNFAKQGTLGSSGANAGEVIRVTPQDETFTIHNDPIENQRPQKTPGSGPPPAPSTTINSADLTEGTLPGWMGAVDGAKYDYDVSDRLRQQTSHTDDNKAFAKHPNNPIAKGITSLKIAEGRLHDVHIASNAVSGIEKAVGLDSVSIVKMIDFVKRSAVEDVKQSTENVNQDKNVLKQINSGITLKKSKVISDLSGDNIALGQAKLKLTDGEHVLADAQDRLSKINKMEMLVTGIEVAKYYASEKASIEVQGYKRNLREVIKRTMVPQSLMNELSVINKKH